LRHPILAKLRASSIETDAHTIGRNPTLSRAINVLFQA
jgi:hypothetical protein